VGPVWIGGAVSVADTPVEEIRAGHGRKLPVVVRWRHTATITLGRAARPYARLQYGPDRGFRNAPVRVRFVPCRHARGHRKPPLPGVLHATFWPGGIWLRRAPACVPITIRIDRGEPVHRTIGLGMHCAES
jgi:hypothetical protein